MVSFSLRNSIRTNKILPTYDIYKPLTSEGERSKRSRKWKMAIERASHAYENKSWMVMDVWRSYGKSSENYELIILQLQFSSEKWCAYLHYSAVDILFVKMHVRCCCCSHCHCLSTWLDSIISTAENALILGSFRSSYYYEYNLHLVSVYLLSANSIE